MTGWGVRDPEGRPASAQTRRRIAWGWVLGDLVFIALNLLTVSRGDVSAAARLFAAGTAIFLAVVATLEIAVRRPVPREGGA